MSEQPPVSARVNRAKQSARMFWIDSLRGGGMLAVVVFHVWRWHLDEIPGWGPATRLWAQSASFAGTLSMPVLYTIAGLLSAKYVCTGLSQRNVRVRVLTCFYLYVAWLLVYFVLSLMLPESLPHHIDGVGDLARQLLLPDTPLWFIWGLGAYTVVIACLTPRWLSAVMVAAVVLALVAPSLSDGGLAYKIPQQFVFFAFASMAPRVFGALGAMPARPFALRVLPAVLVALACSHALSKTAAPNSVAWLLLCAPTVVLAVWVGVALDGWWLMKALAALGRRSMPVYVIHLPVLWLFISLGLGGASWYRTALANPAVAVGYPAVLGLAVIYCCLGIHRVLLALRCDGLFALPAVIAGRVRGDPPRELPGPLPSPYQLTPTPSRGRHGPAC